MGLGVGLGFLQQNSSISLQVQVFILTNNFKARVISDFGAFESESCLIATLHNLNTI
jgi:hypothetical protein